MKKKSHNNIYTIIKKKTIKNKIKNKYSEKNHEKRRKKKNINLMQLQMKLRRENFFRKAY